MDAICIDQSQSDAGTAERNEQVKLMGQIYHVASCVIVWLGKAGKPRIELKHSSRRDHYSRLHALRNRVKLSADWGGGSPYFSLLPPTVIFSYLTMLELLIIGKYSVFLINKPKGSCYTLGEI